VLLVGIGGKADITRKSWRRAVSAAIAPPSARGWRPRLGAARPGQKLLSDERLGRAVPKSPAHALSRQRSQERQETARTRSPACHRSVCKGGAGHREGLHAGQRARQGRGTDAQPGEPARERLHATYLARTPKLAKTHKSLRVKVLGLAEIKREKMVLPGGHAGQRRAAAFHRHGASSPQGQGRAGGPGRQGHHLRHGCISLKDPSLMDEMKFDMSGAPASSAP